MGERFQRANKIRRRSTPAIDGMSTITGFSVEPESEDISFACQSIDLFAVQRAGRHAMSFCQSRHIAGQAFHHGCSDPDWFKWI
jgi:hypothetical protein